MTEPDVTERFREYRRSGDRALRNELIEEHMGFAAYLARRFANRGEPFDDLRQVALIGLVKAIERYDPDRGVAFASFAVPTITGEIKRHFRDRTWSVRVPRNLQEITMAIERVRNELGHELGRSPTITEIADALDVTEEEVLEGLEAGTLYRSASLDAPAHGGTALPLGESLPARVDEQAKAEDHAFVVELLSRLPVRERRIVFLRYFEGLTQTEIAERMGISQMHVSRLLAKSIQQLGVAAGSDLETSTGGTEPAA
jgi:RNA polymerase sigma-B factor